MKQKKCEEDVNMDTGNIVIGSHKTPVNIFKYILYCHISLVYGTFYDSAVTMTPKLKSRVPPPSLRNGRCDCDILISGSGSFPRAGFLGTHTLHNC